MSNTINNVSRSTRTESTRSNNSALSREEASELADLLEEDLKVDIPEKHKRGFSWMKLWAFTGPGWLMSIAYLDPGNLESDLQMGEKVLYGQLGVLFWATILGLILQLLSMRLGVVTGKHLAEMCREKYPPVTRYIVWIAMELAIIGSDIQEVVGSAIAIQILSKGTIPLWGGCVITLIDTFTFLLLERWGVRKLEAFFTVLIGIMAVTFGIEFFISKPDPIDVAVGIVAPTINRSNIGIAVGMLGAVIMPHNLFLHSALVKSRGIDIKDEHQVADGCMYFSIESTMAILISFVINMFVVGTFAAGFANPGDKQCGDNLGITSAGDYLKCMFGEMAYWIWGVGLLAAGQASTCTGTYAGQFLMQGFLHMNIPPWQRVAITRSIAIVPSALVAIFAENILDPLNAGINVSQSVLLPFAIFPVLCFTQQESIMGKFKNKMIINIIAWLIAFLVIGINIYQAWNLLFGALDNLEHNWIWFTLLAVVSLVYAVLMVAMVVPELFLRWRTQKYEAVPVDDSDADAP